MQTLKLLVRSQFFGCSLSRTSVFVNKYFCAMSVSTSSGTMRTLPKEEALRLTRLLAPPLTNERHKGQAGRIGVFGGSLEYTGAPYFAAISALKVGADLSHVFCTKEAAPVIKSYSPELIVHPLLDDQSAAAKIEPWLDRLHVIIIGPGLGREETTFRVITEVLNMCRSLKKPLVIDADGLFYITENREVLKEYPAPVILTPNAMEFQRLVKSSTANKRDAAAELLSSKNLTLLCKGHEDEIFNASTSVTVSGGGSGRRCGGQGDLLSGSVATFLGWALECNVSLFQYPEDRVLAAAFAACTLTRTCNQKAFKKNGRSMTCSDMIKEIHEVFEENFEVKV